MKKTWHIEFDLVDAHAEQPLKKSEMKAQLSDAFDESCTIRNLTITEAK